MYKNITRIILAILVLMLTSINSFAQQEIPIAIKDKILNGINYLENSKTPEDIDKAVKEFIEAAAIAPEYADVHYYLGKTLSMMQGNAGKAVKEFKKYLELYPDAPDKEKVSGEIAQLEEAIKTKNKSYLKGISLIELSDGIYVRQVSPNSPPDVVSIVYQLRGGFSEKSGIKAGDKIAKINNIDIKGYTIQAVRKIIENTDSLKRLDVLIMRGGKTEIIYFDSRLNFNLSNIIKDLGEEDLSALISETKTPSVVFFTSDWCELCENYIPLFQKLATSYIDSIAFITVNIDENIYAAKEFNVSKTPVFYLYKEGKLFDKLAGYDSELLKNKVEALIK